MRGVPWVSLPPWRRVKVVMNEQVEGIGGREVGNNGGLYTLYIYYYSYTTPGPSRDISYIPPSYGRARASPESKMLRGPSPPPFSLSGFRIPASSMSSIERRGPSLSFFG